jgi:uncharacterized membrane protein
MSTKTAHFLSLLFLALALGASLAHVYELPNKIGLSADDYLTVQQIYRGWALLGIAVFGALLSTLALAIMLRGEGKRFFLVLGALLCIVGAQAILNQATSNWTLLPAAWVALRDRWEYSHAAGAALNLAAFILLVLSLLVSQGREDDRGATA